MALQTEQVDVAQLKHMRIGTAVGEMAGLATVGLNGLVLKHKRPLLVRVAFEADLILRRGGAHLFWLHSAVYVVAITALDKSFVHTMMKGHFELSFLLKMARVAKLGLGLYEQKIRFFTVMRRMAGDAAYVVF